MSKSVVFYHRAHRMIEHQESLLTKSLVYYHRSYRKITGSGWIFFIEFLLIAIPLSIVILFTYPQITALVSQVTYSFLSSYYPPGAVTLSERTFLIGNVTIVNVPGSYPSLWECLISLIVCLTLISILPKLKISRNFTIIMTFWLIIHLFSVLFFTVTSLEFPYTMADYSELYIKSEVSMWFFISFILGIAFLPLPSSLIPKILIIILTGIYSIIFGTLRYIVFLFIVSKFSVMYMAILFFAFGPLIDFVYIVGIYCYYTYYLAKNLESNKAVWKWLY
jgi:hypothetical protein